MRQSGGGLDGIFRHFSLEKAVACVFKEFMIRQNIPGSQVLIGPGQNRDHTFSVILNIDICFSCFRVGISSDSLHIHMIFFHTGVYNCGIVVVAYFSDERDFTAQLRCPYSLIGSLSSKYDRMFACTDRSARLWQFIHVQCNINIDTSDNNNFFCMR